MWLSGALFPLKARAVFAPGPVVWGRHCGFRIVDFVVILAHDVGIGCKLPVLLCTAFGGHSDFARKIGLDNDRLGDWNVEPASLAR